MFMGPTGVGKTELGLALAEFLFNDEKSLIRIDMSEFMERHSISKFVGSPPGYVGHEEGGNITELVRHRPYSVILFDEIEKAHPEIFNIMLQILDNGRLTDAKGRHVNFKNSVIIMTSNIGGEFIKEIASLGFVNGENSNAKEKERELKEKIYSSLERRFRPEFINRLDEIIVFNSLTFDSIKKIAKIQLARLTSRLAERSISVSISADAESALAKEGYDHMFGARPLKRLIQNKILNPLAEKIVANKIRNSDKVFVDFREGEYVLSTERPVRLPKKIKAVEEAVV